MTEREQLSESSKVKIEEFRQAYGFQEDDPMTQDIKRRVELLESGGLKVLKIGKVREVYIVARTTTILDKEANK